ncbi:YitT family protein [Candidatus Phytoplasma meliae]|uniref:YitT family protein n=1 Tax=Candidatus Phytoplasma meliae TaxID=1848402 RepID=A0ABS5CYV7_9MOLU|nr:YitT family protein [Candidatus Phytoplasma meliae]MBP5836162.1 YitT family protein [Candidatus Phytoplasma meliae]MBP5836265.1 YitT family protein [Candidatus Phytoplasma meliae]
MKNDNININHGANHKKLNPKPSKIQYGAELKKLLIVFMALIGYDLISVWAINCTGGPSGKEGYKTDLYPGGIHGLGDLIGKLLSKMGVLSYDQITNFGMIFYLVVNIAFLWFISYRYLDLYFTVTTALAAIFLPLMGMLLHVAVKDGFLQKSERFFGLFAPEADFVSDFSRAIFAGFFIGFFYAIPIKLKSSTGGIDIIGKYLWVYKKKNIAVTIEVFGYVLVFIGFIANLFLEGLPNETWKLLLPLLYAFVRIKLTGFMINIIAVKSEQ